MKNALRKIFISFLTTTLCALISLLIINMTFKEVIINGVLYETMRSVLAKPYYSEANVKNPDFGDDVTIKDGEVVTNNDVVNELLKSDEIQDLVNDFIDLMIMEIGSDDEDLSKIDEYDIEGKMKAYLKENKDTLSNKAGIEITDEMIDKSFGQNNNGDLNRYIKDIVKNSKNSMSSEEKKALTGFSFITSTKLRNYIILGIIIDILLLVLTTWSVYKWLKHVGWGLISGGVLPVALGFFIKYTISSSLKIDVNVSPMLNISYIVIGIGVAIEIIYVIIKTINKKQEVQDEISGILKN